MNRVKFSCHDLHAIIGGTWNKGTDNKPTSSAKTGKITDVAQDPETTKKEDLTMWGYIKFHSVHVSDVEKARLIRIVYPPSEDFPEVSTKTFTPNSKSGKWTKPDLQRVISEMPDDHRKLEYGDFSDMTKAVKSFIRERVLYLKTGARPVILNNYLLKGTTEEQASIALVQELLGGELLKEGIRFENEYIIGHTDAAPRLLDGIKIVPDVKSVFSIPSHDKKRELGKEEAIYKTQILGYAWLSGSQVGVLHYCLVPTPPEIIESECKKLYYNSFAYTLGVSFADLFDSITKEELIDKLYNKNSPHAPLYKLWRQTYINHDIERIPKEERLITYSSELTPEWIAHATKRLKRAQEYGEYIWDNPQLNLNKTDNHETEKRR